MKLKKLVEDAAHRHSLLAESRKNMKQLEKHYYDAEERLRSEIAQMVNQELDQNFTARITLYRKD